MYVMCSVGIATILISLTLLSNDMLNNCGAQIPQQCDFLCCENGIFNLKWVPDYLGAAQGK